MKKRLLFSFAGLFCFLMVNAQKVGVIINSPGELAGEYVFGNHASGMGPDLNTGTWTGDLVVVADGSGSDTLGCDALTNGAALSGKIALIDRGVCNFTVKVQNAQDAGAIACVIMNHNNPALSTSNLRNVYTFGGADANITIPSIMLSWDDGLILKAAMRQGKTINLTMGVVPQAKYDLSFGVQNVTARNNDAYVNCPWGAIPVSQVSNDGDHTFNPGAFMKNVGTEVAKNVNVKAIVTHVPSNTEVYNQTSTDPLDIEVDSVRGLLVPVAFDVHKDGKGVGEYKMKYSLGQENPEIYNADNSVTTNFFVTKKYFSKARVNPATGIPNLTGYWGGNGGYREQMTGFRFKHGKGFSIDSLSAGIACNSPSTLAGITVEGKVYKWVDDNADQNITNDELKLVAAGSYSFDPSFTGTTGTFTMELTDFIGNGPFHIMDEDNALYFASIIDDGTSGVATFMPYDQTYDYRTYVESKDAAGTLQWEDYPYLSLTTPDANGNPSFETAGLFTTTNDANVAFFAAGFSLTLSETIVNTKDVLTAEELKIKLSPNPVIDQLVAEVNLKEYTNDISYTIIDMNGHIVFNAADRAGKEFHPSFNVSLLTPGQYFLKVNTDKGFGRAAFTIVK